MIENTLELFKNSTMTFEVVYEDAETLSLDVVTNSEIYDITRELLGKYGTVGMGLAGGGFEHYPLNNGMFLAIGWNSDGPNKFHLGRMGKAF